MPTLKSWSSRELARLRDRTDALFDGWRREMDLPCLPGGDVRLEDLGETLVARIALPGVRLEDLRLEVEDRRLQLAWTRRGEVATAKGTRTRVERGAKRLGLPAPVVTDTVEATLEDGVLTVRLQKA